MTKVSVMIAQRGIAYVEVLIASVLIALALVPAMDALHAGIQSSRHQDTLSQQQYALLAKMETVMAQPFNLLLDAADAAGNKDTPTSYSDTSGTPNRCLVYIARFDGDNADADNNGFTGTDNGILWVRVVVENTNRALFNMAIQ